MPANIGLHYPSEPNSTSLAEGSCLFLLFYSADHALSPSVPTI